MGVLYKIVGAGPFRKPEPGIVANRSKHRYQNIDI